ncbi:alpha/beta fold hydrolase [Fodinicurvata sp. EGI_FJ10296]|uniref:alpha/beta fold hydrolase n=1 Tax=Fodinicurvata sp. EGI_FJ10296 TaxID=3231908 RepID=UPI0034568756
MTVRIGGREAETFPAQGNVPASLRTGGVGPTVVLLHGIGGAARYWTPQLAALADRWRLVAWDMPGYGLSPALDSMTFPALADRAKALIDDLDDGPVTVLGHSIGGMVAQELAATCPEIVGRLILSGTSPAFGRPDGDWQARFLSERLGPLDAGHTMPELATSLVDGLVGNDPDPEGISLAVDCMGSVSEAVYRQSMECLVTFDRREALAGIAVPTLLVAGEKDTNAPAPMMEKMAGKIPGARFAVIAEAGHLASLERPDAFSALVRAFLTETD